MQFFFSSLLMLFGWNPILNGVGAVLQNRLDPWNLTGCITPRLPRSRWIDLPTQPNSDSMRQEEAPGNSLHFPHAPVPIILLSPGQKNITFHLTHFLDGRSFWGQ